MSVTAKNPLDERSKHIDLEIRKFSLFELRSEQLAEVEQLYVEGYAVTFDDPTVLFEYGGIQYKEQIDSKAFNETIMTDVIFNYNHSGKVVARTRNQTLKLTIDTKGLFIRARMDGTKEGRELYEEIQGGYIDRMSFRFTIQEESYDKENHLFTVRKVKKLYDVSAVDIPAYDTTSISARSSVELDRLAEQKALDSAELLRKRKLLLKTRL